MMRYVSRRILHATALLVLISLMSFALVQFAPGDYTDAMRLDDRVSAGTASAWRSRYGLDQPIIIKYLIWLRSTVRGEFGFSFAYGMPVGSLLWPRIQNTLLLTALASIASWCAALALGVVVAVNQSRTLDNFIGSGLSLLHSIPDMLIALALLMFAVRIRSPIGGTHLVLPVLTLVLVSLPILARHVQAAVRDSMTSPFVQAARGHGISSGRLWLRYILPAAANPLISLFGYSIGGLLSSSLLVEVIMGWPGLGPLLLESIFARDVHVVIGATLLSALFLVTGNLMADVLLYALDPRIRWEK
jgi:peptide/nickel transport system permease protein